MSLHLILLENSIIFVEDSNSIVFGFLWEIDLENSNLLVGSIIHSIFTRKDSRHCTPKPLSKNLTNVVKKLAKLANSKDHSENSELTIHKKGKFFFFFNKLYNRNIQPETHTYKQAIEEQSTKIEEREN